MRRQKEAYQGPPWELLFWERLCTADMRPSDPRYRLRMEASLACIPARPSAAFSVLDVGCGIGLYAFGLCRRWPRARVTGVDINPGQIQYAGERALALGLSQRLTFQVADAEELAGVDGPFDVIVAAEIIEHLDRPERMLRRLRELCAPGGRLVLSAPGTSDCHGHIARAYRQPLPDGTFREVQIAAELDPAQPSFELTHRHFAAGELERLLGESGWESTRTVPIRLDYEEIGRVSPRLGRLWKRVQQGRLAPVVAHPAVDRVLNRLSGGRFADSLLLVCRAVSRPRESR